MLCLAPNLSGLQTLAVSPILLDNLDKILKLIPNQDTTSNITKILRFIGKNSMGILVWHLLSYKLITLIQI